MIRVAACLFPRAVFAGAFAGMLAVATVCAVASPAQAQDARLVTRAYDSTEVVTIEGRLGVQVTIGFGEGEQIENVAVGDADKWQITPNKRADLLFVKPLDATARTNMTVVTDKRTYFFDLVASASAKPIYMLRFTYATPHTAVSMALPDPAMLNFAWTRKGTERIGPARIYDDGVSTYLAWSHGQPLPAILLRGEAGEERPVAYAVRGNTTVLPLVPRTILLRADKVSLVLENQNAAVPVPAPALPAPGVAEAAPPEAGTAPAN